VIDLDQENLKVSNTSLTAEASVRKEAPMQSKNKSATKLTGVNHHHSSNKPNLKANDLQVISISPKNSSKFSYTPTTNNTANKQHRPVEGKLP
jgi:hypothetical protein